jgi:hypothetical protein
MGLDDDSQQHLERQYQERLAAAKLDYQKQLAAMQVCSNAALSKAMPTHHAQAFLK